MLQTTNDMLVSVMCFLLILILKFFPSVFTESVTETYSEASKVLSFLMIECLSDFDK